MATETGLGRENTKSVVDVAIDNCIKSYIHEHAIMFNPMGLGVYDLAVANYYFKKAMKGNSLGRRL
jgi:ornithine cyclodeaminase